MFKRLTAAGALTTALCLSSVASAQEERTSKTQARPINDKIFAAAAASCDMSQLAVCRLASSRAKSDEVKKFAQWMIDDHTKCSQEIASLAGRKRVPMPTVMDIKDQAALDCLSGLNGPDFDREFMKLQKVAHEYAVGMFTTWSQRGQDNDWKAFASHALPSLKEHCERATEICKSLKSDKDDDSDSRDKDKDRDSKSDKNDRDR